MACWNPEAATRKRFGFRKSPEEKTISCPVEVQAGLKFNPIFKGEPFRFSDRLEMFGKSEQVNITDANSDLSDKR